MGTLGSPRNYKQKGPQKALENLTTKLEDIKHIRNDMQDKAKIAKTPVNKVDKIGFAPYDSSKNADQAEKKDDTIYKNLQKVKGIGS